MPQMLMSSFYHELNDQWAVMGNLGWQDWSETGKVDIGVASTTPTSLTTPTKYKDTWHTALGVQYQYSEEWLLRSGFGHDSNLEKGHYTSLAAPLGPFWTYGIGTTYTLGANYDLSFDYTVRFYPDVHVDQGGPAGSMQPRVAGEFKNPNLHFFALTFHYS